MPWKEREQKEAKNKRNKKEHEGKKGTHPLELSGGKSVNDAISSQPSVLAALLLTINPTLPFSLPVCHVSSTMSSATLFAYRPAPESSICGGVR